MASLIDRGRAAMQAFLNPGIAPRVSSTYDHGERYSSLYAFWAGEWLHNNVMLSDPRVQRDIVYKNTRQLWRQASAIVDLYDQFVYHGDLPTDGQPLPDGTRGAIPLDIQVGRKQSDGTVRDEGETLAPDASPEERAAAEAERVAREMEEPQEARNLRIAIAEWWSWMNYRQYMSMRPKMGAILGDVLTEIVDDAEGGACRFEFIWPGYVKDLELDLAGNVKAYAVEWLVTEPHREMYGQTRQARTYRYRKEVNTQGFWEYENDLLVSERENPLGFVPALWDRHEIVFGDRGMSALDRTFQQAVEMNSILSNALDYQGRVFGSPIGVKGTAIGNRNKHITINPRATTGDPLADAAYVAESLGLLPMSPEGEFVTLKAEVGQTVEMLNLVMESMQAENPEGQYSQQILEMTQVTAPGVERALGPIIGRVKGARKNYDPQTVKKHQMAVAITGWRVNTNGYPARLLNERRERYDKFRPFDLESYGKGLLDFSIPDREVIPDTIDERIARMQIVEGLQWEHSLRVAGVPPEVIAQVMGERKAEAERQARLDEVMTVGIDPETGEVPPAVVPPRTGA